MQLSISQCIYLVAFLHLLVYCGLRVLSRPRNMLLTLRRRCACLRDTGAGRSLSQSQADFYALWQGQVQILWHARHFRKLIRSGHFPKVRQISMHSGKVRCRLRGRHSTFARSSNYRNRGRRDTFPKSGRILTLSQGQAQISWQAQHSRKARKRFRGWRSTLARRGASLQPAQETYTSNCQSVVTKSDHKSNTAPRNLYLRLPSTPMDGPKTASKSAEGCSFSRLLFPCHTLTHAFAHAFIPSADLCAELVCNAAEVLPLARTLMDQAPASNLPKFRVP